MIVQLKFCSLLYLIKCLFRFCIFYIYNTQTLFSFFFPSFLYCNSRYFSDGFASMPCPLPVLRCEWWIVLPALSEVWRYGARSAFQYCQLFTAHIHDCPCHRAKGRLFHRFTSSYLRSEGLKDETLRVMSKKNWNEHTVQRLAEICVRASWI